MSEHDDARFAAALRQAWGRPELGPDEQGRFDAQLASRIARARSHAPRRILVLGLGLAAAAAALVLLLRPVAPPQAEPDWLTTIIDAHTAVSATDDDGSSSALDAWVMAGLSPATDTDVLAGLLPADWVAVEELVALPASAGGQRSRTN